MDDGWEASAAAWIADMGETGDFGRRYVLDPVMLARVGAASARKALDVGCGEGRFCRMLRAKGIEAVGLDPTRPLLAHARQLDPGGAYIEGVAETLPFGDGAFDLVVSYLSLIDIPDVRRAIPEMVRVLAPGGQLLIANLNGFNTAGAEHGWVSDDAGGRRYFALDNYTVERATWFAWRGIHIVNHHRPLGLYLQLCIDQGLILTHFSEPLPTPDAPAERAATYTRAPWFCVMEWEKPVAPAR
jgi:SAM-dependent methyltransferase